MVSTEPKISGSAFCLRQNLRQHMGQNSSSPVVVLFHRGIDGGDDGEIEAGAVGSMDAEGGLQHRLEVVVDAEEYSSEKYCRFPSNHV